MNEAEAEAGLRKMADEAGDPIRGVLRSLFNMLDAEREKVRELKGALNRCAGEYGARRAEVESLEAERDRLRDVARAAYEFLDVYDKTGGLADAKEQAERLDGALDGLSDPDQGAPCWLTM